jgi:Tol biopolymer transport system component
MLRPLDRLETTVLAEGAQGEGPFQPFFSPDGKWLAYMTNTELKKMPVSGGSPIRLAEVDFPRGGSWSSEGTIVFAARSRGGLSLVPAAGGEVQTLTEVDPDQGFESHRWPQWLPGGKAVLFSVASGQGAWLEIVDIASRERRQIHPQGVYGRYVSTGHLLFVDSSALFALPFDPNRLEVQGSPMPVLDGVSSEQDDAEAQFDVSDNGVLVYMPGADQRQGFETSWADRTGTIEPLWEQTGFYGTPRLSPEGRRLAVSLLRGENWDVWVYDIERDVATRITFGSGYDADPIWSPDGRWLAFASESDEGIGMYRKRSDGTGESEVLIEPGKLDFPAPTSWSPDGRRIAFTSPPESGDSTVADVFFVSVDGGEVEPYLTTPFRESDPFISPDGRWLAYTSNESGRTEVYVRSLEGDGRWQITDGFGAQPLWSPAGDELFYRAREGLMAVSVEVDGGEFQAGRSERLFGEIFGNPLGVTVPGYLFYDYDIAPDGQRFVVFPRVDSDDTPASRVHIVTGWFEELRSLTESAGD